MLGVTSSTRRGRSTMATRGAIMRRTRKGKGRCLTRTKMWATWPSWTLREGTAGRRGARGRVMDHDDDDDDDEDEEVGDDAQDLVSKVMSFSQNGCAVYVLSAGGDVSNATLRQSASSSASGPQ